MIDIELLGKYNEAKAKLEHLKGEMQRRQDAFSEANEMLIGDINAYSTTLSELKIRVEAEAKEEYKETGSKALTGGVGIRVSKNYDYIDEEAIKWIKEHHHEDALLDQRVRKTPFKKMVDLNAANMPFVKVEEKVSVTFPSKAPSTLLQDEARSVLE